MDATRSQGHAESGDRLLLRVEESAAVLNISRARLFELIGSGQIRSLKLGRSRRIPRAELERWVESQLELQSA